MENIKWSNELVLQFHIKYLKLIQKLKKTSSTQLAYAIVDAFELTKDEQKYLVQKGNRGILEDLKKFGLVQHNQQKKKFDCNGARKFTSSGGKAIYKLTPAGRQCLKMYEVFA